MSSACYVVNDSSYRSDGLPPRPYVPVRWHPQSVLAEDRLRGLRMGGVEERQTNIAEVCMRVSMSVTMSMERSKRTSMSMRMSMR